MVLMRGGVARLRAAAKWSCCTNDAKNTDSVTLLLIFTMVAIGIETVVVLHMSAFRYFIPLAPKEGKAAKLKIICCPQLQ